MAFKGVAAKRAWELQAQTEIAKLEMDLEQARRRMFKTRKEVFIDFFFFFLAVIVFSFSFHSNTKSKYRFNKIWRNNLKIFFCWCWANQAFFVAS